MATCGTRAALSAKATGERARAEDAWLRCLWRYRHPIRIEGLRRPRFGSVVFDVPPDTSKPIDLTFRNIEQPSTKEYIVRLDITVRYDGSHRLEIPDVFFSSAAIGSYYPAYERKLIRPEPHYSDRRK